MTSPIKNPFIVGVCGISGDNLFTLSVVLSKPSTLLEGISVFGLTFNAQSSMSVGFSVPPPLVPLGITTSMLSPLRFSAVRVLVSGLNVTLVIASASLKRLFRASLDNSFIPRSLSLSDIAKSTTLSFCPISVASVAFECLRLIRWELPFFTFTLYPFILKQ